VHAFDSDLSKLERLRHRAARAGADRISIHSPVLPGALRVDRVLVDAPCSELGALRRGPDLRFRIDPASFAALPSLQLQLLESALGHLKPGGTLVYATCTLRREENQEVALAFHQRHPELERLRPGAGWLGEECLQDGFFLCLPHRHGTDGFFAAVYRRPSTSSPAVSVSASPLGPLPR
jgi:16S rRNA (cytosine967-C5)-methyltransferase